MVRQPLLNGRAWVVQEKGTGRFALYHVSPSKKVDQIPFLDPAGDSLYLVTDYVISYCLPGDAIFHGDRLLFVMAPEHNV